MSYRRPHTGNPLNNYMKSLNDFYTLVPHLLNANSKFEFEIWLEKLEQIDRRSLLLYMKKHKDEFKPEFLEMVQDRYLEEL